jgi:hypothetical protein
MSNISTSVSIGKMGFKLNPAQERAVAARAAAKKKIGDLPFKATDAQKKAILAREMKKVEPPKEEAKTSGKVLALAKMQGKDYSGQNKAVVISHDDLVATMNHWKGDYMLSQGLKQVPGRHGQINTLMDWKKVPYTEVIEEALLEEHPVAVYKRGNNTYIDLDSTEEMLNRPRNKERKLLLSTDAPAVAKKVEEADKPVVSNIKEMREAIAKEKASGSFKMPEVAKAAPAAPAPKAKTGRKPKYLPTTKIEASDLALFPEDAKKHKEYEDFKKTYTIPERYRTKGGYLDGRKKLEKLTEADKKYLAGAGYSQAFLTHLRNKQLKEEEEFYKNE